MKGYVLIKWEEMNVMGNIHRHSFTTISQKTVHFDRDNAVSVINELINQRLRVTGFAPAHLVRQPDETNDYGEIFIPDANQSIMYKVCEIDI